MGDEIVKYQIDYSAPPGKITADIAKIMGELTKLDALAIKVAGKLKSLGTNSPGLTKYRAELIKLDAELKHKVTDSDAAEKALKKVGQGNSAVTALTARVEKLKLELEALTAAANAAKTAGAGVGTGGGAGSGGPSPTPGSKPAAKNKGKAGLEAGAAMMVMAVTNLGTSGLREAGEGAQKGRDYFTEATGRVQALRDDAREYASLRKQPGSNDKILREITDFAKATGATPEDSVKFLTTYEGSATTGRDKGNIGGVVGQNGFTQEKQDALEAKLKVVGGQFAMATGLDAKTAGDLTAVISTYSKINSESDLAGQLAGAHYGIDQGRGEISPLARSELGQAGMAIESGHVSGLPELGAFVGVASVASKTPGSSGTTYGQVSRLLNEVGGDGEDFLKEVGVADKKGDFAKLKALRDHLASAKPDDTNAYLEKAGFKNSTDRRSLLGMVGNVDVLEARIKKAKEVAADGAAAMKRLAENQKQIGVVGPKIKAQEFAVDVESGLQNEKLEIGRTAALSRLKDPTQPGGPRINTPATSIVDAVSTPFMAWSNTGEAERIDLEAIEGLKRGGQAVGIDIAKKYPKLMRYGIFGRDAETDTARRELYGKAYDEVLSAGGDPFGGAPENAAQALRKAADALDKMKPPPAAGRPAGPPAPPPAGKGGTGVNPGRR